MMLIEHTLNVDCFVQWMREQLDSGKYHEHQRFVRHCLAQIEANCDALKAVLFHDYSLDERTCRENDGRDD